MSNRLTMPATAFPTRPYYQHVGQNQKQGHRRRCTAKRISSGAESVGEAENGGLRGPFCIQFPASCSIRSGGQGSDDESLSKFGSESRRPGNLLTPLNDVRS